MGTIAIPFGPDASIIGKIIDPYVNRFTGIPFALPPVGDNRWRRPRKLPTDFFQKLGKPYDATGFKDLCLQLPSPLPHDFEEHVNYSEDCLYVNVWAPSAKPPPGGWPVIIWIHGGWLQVGDPMFDTRIHPWQLISKDGYGLGVVVVAPGYRLSIFGFLGAEADGELPGNWGFWDQRCAIEWISENVQYFGGDNANVTIGGVSAAQVQLFYELFQAPENQQKPLFHRIWMASNAMPAPPKTLQEGYRARILNVPLDSPTSDKLSQLRAIPGGTMLKTLLKLKIPTFRATLDNVFIPKDVFKYLYSGELARRFHQRNMKLLIGEVEHEEMVYNIGAPLKQPDLLPALQNYYRSSVARALIDHYMKKDSDIASVYTEIVTDVQIRATTRAFSKALVDGGVPLKDILRYRISLPIKAMDELLALVQMERFAGKVAHSFDFLHWWYTERIGFNEIERNAIKQWLAPFENFLRGEEVPWGTSNVMQFRHLTEDGRVEVVRDIYWAKLMDTASILQRTIEEDDRVTQGRT